MQKAWQRADRLLVRLMPQGGNKWALAVAFSALVIYFFVQIALPYITGPGAYMYLWQPLLWSYLALLAGLGWRYGLQVRPRPGWLGWLALILALFQIAMLVLVGLIQGFGRSPFDHRLPGLLGNLWYLGTLLAGVELSRAYLMASFGKHRPGFALVLTTLLFTLLTSPLGIFYKFDSPRGIIEASGSLLLPNLAENLLASLLAFGGGPLASILYRGVLLGMEWFSPILPDPNWFIKALIGTLTPAIGMLVVHNHLEARAIQSRPNAGGEKAEGFNLTWAFVGLFGLLLVGFNTGLFGLQPTLIASNSMSPNFWVGDVVVTRDVEAVEIEVGDVIRFRDGSRSTVHRVIEIQEDSGRRVFITRGDTNDANDPPVVEQALQGKVIMTIPKLGWLSIYLRQLVHGESG